MLEMISSADALRNVGRTQPNFRPVLEALQEYSDALDKEAVLKKHKLFPKPYWWDHRLQEHKEFEALTHGLDFQGKTVLDVGAGHGSDSLRYSERGASVTCLEFSFSMFGPGKHTYPELQWVGGAGHALPFEDEQFDFVAAHNSLHHHTDQTVSLTEMLRVLKPGGSLITLCDPFRSNALTEMDECRIFNNHPAVLTGINEQVPCFRKFGDAFVPHIRKLTGHVLFTKSGTERTETLPLEEALRLLPFENGGISLVVQKTAPTRIKPQKLKENVIEPAEFAADLIAENNQVFRKLAAKIDPKYLDLPLLDNTHPKFRLLNGWKLHEDGARDRTAFRRARMFFSRGSAAEQRLAVCVSAAHCPESAEFDFYVSIDGQVIYSSKLVRGMRHQLSLQPWETIPKPTGSFFVEIGLSLATGAVSDFQADAASLLAVDRLEFSSGSVAFQPEALEVSGAGRFMGRLRDGIRKRSSRWKFVGR
jgi:SAM-dependent methyltransferase